MGRDVSWALITLFAVGACGGSPARPTEDTRLAGEVPRLVSREEAARWVVLKMSRVEVTPTKASGATWDGQQERSSNGCGLASLLGESTAGPLGGAVATFICQSDTKQAEREPQAPDIMVHVKIGELTFRTPIAMNTYAEAFDYAVVVPLLALGPMGVEIEVRDHDKDAESGELIGRLMFTRSDLERARRQTPPLLVGSDTHVKRMEIAVLPYSAPAGPTSVELAVSQQSQDTALTVRAGELVTISAAGRFSVASDGEFISVRGYPSGEKQNYNLEDFATLAHGAAVAFIGGTTATRTALLVENCIEVVAPHPGPLQVGINDSDPGNNSGSVTFDVAISLPTVEQWKRGQTRRCDR